MDTLMHYGIPGQKWYKRRFQNPDGTLTPEGKIRYSKTPNGSSITVKSKQQTSSRPASVSQMSNQELRERIERIELERRYAALTPQKVSRGKAILSHIGSKVILPVADDVAKMALKSYLKSAISDKTGLKLQDEKKDKKKD